MHEAEEIEMLEIENDFDYLLSYLPEGWQEQAREQKALVRCRKFPDAEVLLRTLLLHLAEGLSLRETAVRLQQGGIIKVSDVAIMDRLRSAGPWFRWINQRLMQQWVAPLPRWSQHWAAVCVADGTRIQEQGRTGSGWMVHYATELGTLRCHEVQVCDWGDSGEGFGRFKIAAGELWIGDRAYGKRPGIAHVAAAGADLIVRFVPQSLPMKHGSGKPFALLDHLRKLPPRGAKQWPVQIETPHGLVKGRVCAVRKSPAAATKAVKRVRAQAVKNQDQVQAETIEAAHYIFVFTTVSSSRLSAPQVLEVYRGRWQIEVVFKRLKSILAFGHLPKRDPTAICAWIEGKLMVALLVEALVARAESFFPWGYPLEPQLPAPQVPMA